MGRNVQSFPVPVVWSGVAAPGEEEPPEDDTMPVTAGLIGWYAARRLGLAEAAPVTEWTDLSGHGNHLIPNSAAWRPLFRIAPGGNPDAVEFDGNDDFLFKNTPYKGTPTGFTIIFVGQITPGTPAAGAYDLFALQGGGGGGGGLQIWLRYENKRRRIYELVGNSVTSSYQLNGLPSVCARMAFGSPGTLDLDIFGTLPETQKATTTTPNFNSFVLGKTSLTIKGYVYEFALWNRRLTDAERNLVYAKFSAIYLNGILSPASAAPAPPTDLTAYGSASGITAAWTAPAIANGYLVQASYDGGAWADVPYPLGTNDPNPIPEPDTVTYFLDRSTTVDGDYVGLFLYRIRVRATNIHGDSDWSDPADCIPAPILNPEGGANIVNPETGETLNNPEP